MVELNCGHVLGQVAQKRMHHRIIARQQPAIHQWERIIGKAGMKARGKPPATMVRHTIAKLANASAKSGRGEEPVVDGPAYKHRQSAPHDRSIQRQSQNQMDHQAIGRN